MERSLVIDLIVIGLILSAMSLAIGYYLGRSRGEKFVKDVFDETITDFEQEQKENIAWVQNGKRPNQVPAPRFGLTSSLEFPDPRFQLKQSMGQKIKSLREDKE
jgi:hypothetical protein